MYVLTMSVNAYDQEGDYLVSVFDHKPTAEELRIIPDFKDKPNYFLFHILDGGGRMNAEHVWYHLTQLSSGEVYERR